MKIIKDNGSSVLIEFQDDYKFQTETIYQNFIRGQVLNPYDKNCYGKGFIGVGKHTTRENPTEHVRVYIIWRDLIRRCYSEQARSLYPAYYNICSVCEEWCNYQNFADWYEINQYEVEGRLHLDKDILFSGNKLYSPDTCLLVPQRINMLFVNRPNKKRLPNGITLVKSGYKAEYNNENLGIHPSLKIAYSAYAKRKEEEIKRIAEEYKNIIPKKLYDALLNYKVLIENDKNYINNNLQNTTV